MPRIKRKITLNSGKIMSVDPFVILNIPDKYVTLIKEKETGYKTKLQRYYIDRLNSGNLIDNCGLAESLQIIELCYSYLLGSESEPETKPQTEEDYYKKTDILFRGNTVMNFSTPENYVDRNMFQGRSFNLKEFNNNFEKASPNDKPPVEGVTARHPETSLNYINIVCSDGIIAPISNVKDTCYNDDYCFELKSLASNNKNMDVVFETLKKKETNERLSRYRNITEEMKKLYVTPLPDDFHNR